MKVLMYLFAAGIFIFQNPLMVNAQTTTTSQVSKTNTFGQTISAAKPIKADQLPQMLAGKDSVNVKVAGVVQEVCQVKGCWMDVKLTDNTRMKVRFRDYGFFVPKNLSGKEVVFEGTAYQEVISVTDQQHYLKDAGKSAAEIKAIVQPKKEITFMADGVQLR